MCVGTIVYGFSNAIRFTGSCSFKSRYFNANRMSFFFSVLSWILMRFIWILEQAILTINHKWWIWNSTRSRMAATSSTSVPLKVSHVLCLISMLNWKSRDYMISGSVDFSLHLHNTINSFGIIAVLVRCIFVCIGACWGFCGHTNQRIFPAHFYMHAQNIYIFADGNGAAAAVAIFFVHCPKCHRPHCMYIEWHTWFEVITAHCSLDQYPRAPIYVRWASIHHIMVMSLSPLLNSTYKLKMKHTNWKENT